MHVKSQHEWSSWHVLPTLLNGWEAYNLLKRLVPLNASSFRYLWLIITRIYHKYQNFDFSRSPSSKSTNGNKKAAWFHCSCSLHPPPRLSWKKKKKRRNKQEWIQEAQRTMEWRSLAITFHVDFQIDTETHIFFSFWKMAFVEIIQFPGYTV